MGTQMKAAGTLSESYEQSIANRKSSPVWDWLKWAVTPPRVAVCGGFILLLVIAAIIAPLIADPDHAQLRAGFQHLTPAENPPFGTDDLGRSIYSRIVFGTRITLTVGIVSVIFA